MSKIGARSTSSKDQLEPQTARPIPTTLSTSWVDHVEAIVGKGMIATYDALRATEGAIMDDPVREEPPAWLAEAWSHDDSEFEYPEVKTDRHAELGDDAAREEGRELMDWDPKRGDIETRAAVGFFEANPSDAAKTVTWFQTIWNAFETFDNYPLQAFMYATASPVTTPEASGGGAPPEEERTPSTPLWEAYVRAIEEEVPQNLIEEAYFRAHIADMKAAFKSARFEKLYDLAPPNYRVVVEAYAETIARAELELNGGRPIGSVSRGLFVDGLRDLVKRGTVGMLHTKEGLSNLAKLSESAKLLVDNSVGFFGFLGSTDRDTSTAFDSVWAWFDNDDAMIKAMADEKVEIHEIWELTQDLRGYFSGKLDRRDIGRLRDFGEKNRAHLTPEAARLLDKLVAHGPSGPMSDEKIENAPKVDPKGPVPIDLSADELTYLQEELGIAVESGASVLTEEMFANATFTEPDRREDRSTPLKRWPLKLSDLVDSQLRRGLTMAGTDGALQFDEIMGGLRNVQARVRSELIADFDEEYPVAPGAILNYSANVLSLHKTYGENEFYGMVPNAIMPVDNDGAPKNQLWRDFTDAYDQHKESGNPSYEELEKLWIRAHMEDFAAVDAPGFQEKMDAFWEAAAFDPALESMAVYTKAMVLGRSLFDRAREENLTEAAAMAESLGHFGKTMAESGMFPFLKEDVQSALDYFKHDRHEPSHDDRGLPTDRTFAERAAAGAVGIGGLASLLARGYSQKWSGAEKRPEADELMDITEGMTPEQASQLDPMVIDFYNNPTRYDMTAVADMPQMHMFMSEAMSLVSGMGNIPMQKEGESTATPAPVEQELWKDEDGKVHWDRDIVVDGHKETLFHATMEMEGGQLKETFDIRGVEVPLYFDVTPYNGGVQILLDTDKSSPMAPKSIVFHAVPDGDGMLVTGTYDIGTGAAGVATFVVTKKDMPKPKS